MFRTSLDWYQNEGALITAFALLIGLQYLITWSSVRSRRIERLVKAQPSLLYSKGKFLEDMLRRQRVTESEVSAAVREQGIPDMAGVGAVILETDGSLTVLVRSGGKIEEEVEN